ncbi:MAG: ral stress protein [Actinomycetia bacterium]|nr:ral stress protein [Actinomycetes bacterium]
MRYTRLGQTDLEVSVLALGAWAPGADWDSFDDAEADAAIKAALDEGVNLFDASQANGFGDAEALLGDTLWKRVRRDRVIVATKGGLRVEGRTLVRDASAHWLRTGVVASLRNLDTDYIDLYQVRWPDPATPAEETAAALQELVAEGLVRHVGVSNGDAGQIDGLARHGRVESLQLPYNMFRREIEVGTLPYASVKDIGVLIDDPLAHGLLGGRLTTTTTFPPDDWRSHSPGFTGAPFRRNLGVVTRLTELAVQWGVSVPQLAVAWTIGNPSVDVAIVGARRSAQLDALMPAVDVRLGVDDLHRIDAILAEAAPISGPTPEGM